MDQGRQQEIIVIGAGLGGLASAALLARGGARVRVLDSAQHAGGRALLLGAVLGRSDVEIGRASCRERVSTFV